MITMACARMMRRASTLCKLGTNFSHMNPAPIVIPQRSLQHNRNRPGKREVSHDDKEISFDATFGFERVTPKAKQERVVEVFSAVASRYDRMNDVMSFGIHRCWKNYFVHKKFNPLPGTQLLDVAGGTGDIAFLFLDHIADYDQHQSGANLAKSSVTVLDINDDMMEAGKNRAEVKMYDDPGLIKWVQGDAAKLPFPDNSFDAYTIAFGIRNVVNIEKALEEAYRVLKPGGIFLCLEFSRVQNPLISSLYDWYSFNVIPVMGKIIAGDWKSYQYLVESIRQFPDQKDFAHMIETAGFTMVEYENLSEGIAAIHTGYKPLK